MHIEVKKHACYFLVLLMSIPLLSCYFKPSVPKGTEEASLLIPLPSPSPEVHSPIELDFSSAYAGVQNERLFIHGNTVYYLCFAGDGKKDLTQMIYISDIVNKEWMPLCGRPDCMHNDKDCSAFLEFEPLSAMWPYGDHIYYITQDFLADNDDPFLWRMGLDGYDHERLLEITPPDTETRYSYEWDWVFFGKYAVITYMTDNENETSPNRYTFVIDVSAKKPEQKLFETGEALPYYSPIIGEGDVLYSVDRDTKTLCRTDFREQTLERICELPIIPTGGVIRGTELILCTRAFDAYTVEIVGGEQQAVLKHYDSGIVRVDLETGEVTVVKNSSENGLWGKAYDNYIIGGGVWNNGETERRGTFIYDLSGKLLQEVQYPDTETIIEIRYIIDNYVFGFDKASGTNSLPMWYLDLNDIGTDNLMWRRWEPEG